jgi:hypothetical protein
MSQKQQRWSQIAQRNKRSKEEFMEYLGEEIENDIDDVTEGEKEYYNSIKEIVEKVIQMVPKGSTEKEYQTQMLNIMKESGREVEEEVEEEITEPIEGWRDQNHIRIDIREIKEEEGILYELKTGSVSKHGLDQIHTYMYITKSVMGYVINFNKSAATIYMVVKGDSDNYICYDGKKSYRSPQRFMKRIYA